MIDYTQFAFASPPNITDPLPSVADYLDDYKARNEAWYQSWAFPQEGGGFGSRPESFDVRAPYLPPVEDVTPPILKESPSLASGPPESTRTEPGEMPVGALVRNPTEMTSNDLWGEFLGGMGTDPYGKYGAGLLGSILSMGTLGVGTVAGLMAEAGIEQRRQDVANEIGRRMGSAFAPPRDPTKIFEGGGPSGKSTVRGGTTIFTTGDVLPTETGSHQGGQSSGSAPAGLSGGWDDETGFGGA